jgi:hypothetical protein
MVETGLVVSGVLPTSMMSISSSMISSRATSAARLGFDWLSLTMTSSVKVVPPEAMPPDSASSTPLMMNSSTSAKAASGPVCGVT